MQKNLLSILLLLLLGCRDPKTVSADNSDAVKMDTATKSSANTARHDSPDSCEDEEYVSTMTEIPRRIENAYRLTITSKKDGSSFTKILDARPKMSKIRYCNELYTVVGFSCGGPCFCRIFVFHDASRPLQQYAYPTAVKNDIRLISHIEDEDFGHLIIQNLANGKHLSVDMRDMNAWVYGQPDSMVVKKKGLVIYYQSRHQKSVSKNVDLTHLLDESR